MNALAARPGGGGLLGPPPEASVVTLWGLPPPDPCEGPPVPEVRYETAGLPCLVSCSALPPREGGRRIYILVRSLTRNSEERPTGIARNSDERAIVERSVRPAVLPLPSPLPASAEGVLRQGFTNKVSNPIRGLVYLRAASAVSAF